MQRCLELGLILTRSRPFILVAGLVCAVAITHRQVEAADDLGPRRAKLDAAFQDHLEALARRCDELEMDDAARTTRQWFVRRDPNRRYVFLIPDRDQTVPSPGAPKQAQQWYAKFRMIRNHQADAVWQLAGDAIDTGRAGPAYRWLHEVVRENPDHEAARRLLGYRRGQGGWQNVEARSRTRRGRGRHPQFGWRPRTSWYVETPHYRVETNQSRRAAEELAQRLEELHTVWRQLFLPFWSSPAALRESWEHLSPIPTTPRRHRVVLFRDRQEYVRFLQVVEPRIGITLGIYRHPDRTAYFFGGADRLAATWRHEATHQLFHEIVGASENVGSRANFWIVEGVALYMESLRSQGDYCTLGGIDADRLQYARYRALNERYYVPLQHLASMNRRQIQEAENIRRIYSQAAGLTHFLMHYDNGRYRPLLVEYLRRVYAEHDHAGTLAELANQPLGGLDREYRDFLQVRDEDLAHLKDRPGLTKLSLGHTSVTDAGLRHLEHVSDLEWFDVAYCNVSDTGLAQLREARRLRQCNLEHTNVTDITLDMLSNLDGLEELDLSFTRITDAGLAKLAKLTRLKVLWLTGTQITDAGLNHLRPLRRLETLDLTSTQVTRAAVQQLHKQIPSLNRSASD